MCISWDLGRVLCDKEEISELVTEVFKEVVED